MASHIVPIEEVTSAGMNVNPQDLHGQPETNTTSDTPDNISGANMLEDLNSVDVSYEIFCEYCGIACTTLDDHVSHLKDEHDVHKKENTIQVYLTEELDNVLSVFPTCSICDETFENDDALVQHGIECKEKQTMNYGGYKQPNMVVTPSFTRDVDTKSTPHHSKTSAKSTSAITFKCQFCESRFTSRDQLESHVDQGHELSARYVCTLCKKAFDKENSLFRHLNVVHPIYDDHQGARRKPIKTPNINPDILYKCPFCDRRNIFSWFKSLKIHIRNFHNDYTGMMNKERFEVNASDLENQNGNIDDIKVIAGASKDELNSTPVDWNGQHVYTCPQCDLVSYYAFSIAKHLVRKHAVTATEAKQMVLRVDKCTIDLRTIKSMDRKASKQRLKQYAYNYVCPKCNFATYQLSNFKTHIFSQKHKRDFSKDELDQMDFHSMRVQLEGGPDTTLLADNQYFKCSRCWFISHTVKDIDHHMSEERHIDEYMDGRYQVVQVDETSETEDADLIYPFYKCPVCGLYVSDGIDQHIATQHGTDVKTSNMNVEPVEMVVKYLPHKDIAEITKSTTNIKSTTAEDGHVASNVSDGILFSESDENVDETSETDDNDTGTLKQVACPLCKSVFHSCHELMSHCSRHTTVQVYFQCQHCPSQFVRFSAMKRHHWKQHADVPFTTTKMKAIGTKIVSNNDSSSIHSCSYVNCPYCSRTIASVATLMRHVVRSHIEKLQTCVTVNEEIQTDAELNNSNGTKKCVVCLKTFKSCVELTQHLPIHRDVISFGCDFCDLSCNSLLQLVKHMVKHSTNDDEEESTKHADKSKSKVSNTRNKVGIDEETVQVTFMKNMKTTNKDGNASQSPTNQTKESTNASKNRIPISDVNLKELTVSLDKIDDSSNKTTPMTSNSRIKIVTPIFANKTKQSKANTKVSNEASSSKAHRVKSLKDETDKQINKEEIDVKTNNCPHCNMSFKRASALVFHVNLSHSKEKNKISASKVKKTSASSGYQPDQKQPIADKDINARNRMNKSMKVKETDVNVESKSRTEKTRVTTRAGSKRNYSFDTPVESPKKKRTDVIMKTIAGKECRIKTVNVFSGNHGNSSQSSNSTSDDNKCPHCEYSCKRSSALTFHINFNHAKLSKDLQQNAKRDGRKRTAFNDDTDDEQDIEELSFENEQKSPRKTNITWSGKTPSIKVIKDGQVVANLHVKIVKKTNSEIDKVDNDSESTLGADNLSIRSSVTHVPLVVHDACSKSPSEEDELDNSATQDSLEMECMDSPYITGVYDVYDSMMTDVGTVIQSGKPGSNIKYYRCNACNVRYSSHSALWRHNKIKHNRERKYSCDQCDREFTFKNQLSNHMRSHMEKTIMCEYDGCDSRFSCEKYQIKHMVNIHGHVPPKKDKPDGTEKKVYYCDTCDIEYSSNSALWRHKVKNHSERERNHACPRCPQTFMWPTELQEHMVIHETAKMFVCNMEGCGRRFRRSKDRMYHMRRIHQLDIHGEKVFKCAICKKVFKQFSSLQGHLASHRTEGGLSGCDECGEVFQDSAMLKDHLVTHAATDLDDGESKLTFANLDTLVDIDTSKATLLSEDDLNQTGSHLEDCNATQEQGAVPAVTKTRKRSSDTKVRHVRPPRRSDTKVGHIHPTRTSVPLMFHCDQCGKLYGSSTALKTHQQKHHGDGDRPQKCDQCPKSYWHPYELKDHKASVHTAENLFICDECGKGFPTYKGFQNHLKRHQAKAEEEAGIMPPPMTCDLCGFVISSRSGRQALYKHVQRSHPETVYCNCVVCSSFYDECNTVLLGKAKAVCHICNQCFCQKRFLDSHVNTVHSQSGSRECKFCTARFATPKMLSNHVHKDHKLDQTTFQNSLPIDDAVSNETASSFRHTLKVDSVDANSSMHIIQIGQDEMPQYLPKLNEGSLSAVIKELRVQNDDPETLSSLPFKCLLCGRCFAKVKYVNLHIRRNHIKNEDQPYRCKVCGSGFVRLAEFRKHSRAHSNFRPYKCRHCKKAFKQQSNLKDHEIIHSYARSEKCLLCKKTFKQRGALTSHLLSHSKVHPFKCPFCEKAYPDRGQLSRHMKQYLSIKEKWVHMCHICSETFTHFPLLMTHLSTHNPSKPFKCEVCQDSFRSFVQIYFHKAQKGHFTPVDFEGIHQVEEQENAEVILTSGDLQTIEFPTEDGNDFQPIKTNELTEIKSEMIDQSKSNTFSLDQSELSILNSNSEVVIETVGFERDGTVFTVPDGHTSDEILSIAKQLTELSGYTKSPGKHATQGRKKDKEQMKIEDAEQEILLGMLDVDEDKLESLEKLTQSMSHRKWEEISEIRNEDQLQEMDYDGHPIVEAETVCYENGLEEMETEVATERTNLYNEPQYPQAVSQTVNSFGDPDTIAVDISDTKSDITGGQPQQIEASVDGNVIYIQPEQVQATIADSKVGSAAQTDQTEAAAVGSDDNLRVTDEGIQIKISESPQNVVTEVASNIAISEHDYWGHLSALGTNTTSADESAAVVYVYVDSADVGNPEHGSVVQVINGLEYMGMPGANVDLVEAVSQLDSDPVSSQVSQIDNLDTPDKLQPAIKVDNVVNAGIEKHDTEVGMYETEPCIIPTEGEVQHESVSLANDTVHIVEFSSDGQQMDVSDNTINKHEPSLPEQIVLRPETVPLPVTLPIPDTPSPDELVVESHAHFVDTTSELAKNLIGTAVNDQKGQILEEFEAWSEANSGVNFIEINIKDTEAVDGYFLCPICEVRTKSRKNLRKHIQRHQGPTEKQFACDHPGCERRFFQRPELRRHSLTHNNIRPHKCVKCGKSFRQTGHLQTHMRIHTGERPFVCPVPNCNNAYITGTQMKIHCMRAHVEENHFVCSFCSKSFKDRHSFAVHIGNNHSGSFGVGPKKKEGSTENKPNPSGRVFICELCGIQLSSKCNLDHHMSTHNDTKPYICHACGEAFRTLRVLKQHMASKHRPEDAPTVKKRVWKKSDKTYKCEGCQKVFRGREGYAYHIGSNEKCRSALVLPSVELPDVRFEI